MLPSSGRRQKLGRTPAQIALAWTLSIAPNVLLIPGTSSVKHLEENTAVADIELDEATKRQLDDARLDHSTSTQSSVRCTAFCQPA